MTMTTTTTKPGAACAFYYAFEVPLAWPQAFEWWWCVTSRVPRPVRKASSRCQGIPFCLCRPSGLRHASMATDFWASSHK